eukprot:gnl/TRDRNA2_/TRDRNA2_177505_c0_seq2.p1 gnl/TRDRNA2_/TRDRNA2_177505_c0~~gnl/TRDRNA2_/TRDRNA2_177505_c0_seq2.p1  ORF type:complete len:476 (+),score=99.61 gnl/TRDRNA2_/TRDRNA2_177505_c0_seq2:73-1500(+)
MMGSNLAETLLQRAAAHRTCSATKVVTILSLITGIVLLSSMPLGEQDSSQPALAMIKARAASFGASRSVPGAMRASHSSMSNHAAQGKLPHMSNSDPRSTVASALPTNMEYPKGKDTGGFGIAGMTSCENCILAEYVWLDLEQVPRSKTMTITHIPNSVDDLRTWNYDGSSTGQAEGSNSEVKLKPRAIFKDPFRGAPHIIVLAEAYNSWDDAPTIGNTRAAAVEIMDKYGDMDPWFGMEQEYTLMRPKGVGEVSDVPYGFNNDGTEPAPQGPYYCGAGDMKCIGREIAEEHYFKCLEAGVKISGINAEVMPGQWEYQVGPCRGIEMGDHLTIARYIMLRVTEGKGVIASLDPKPREEGDWNGAGCHCNFSTKGMREDGGYEVITKVCNAFGENAALHIAEYGEGNEKRLTGKHETCSINDFKFGLGDRGASIRIPRDAEKDGKGYMEDRRPAANCDPYVVTKRMMQTTGECLER